MSEDNMTGWMKVLRPNAAEEETQAKEKADDRLARTACSPSSFPAMPLAAALEFADSGESTGGIMTHEALKTLAAAIRGKRCEFCNEPPLTENERKFLSENVSVLAQPGEISTNTNDAQS